MHPFITQALAAERGRDLRARAAAAGQARMARAGRAHRAGLLARTRRRAVPDPLLSPCLPDTYQEFLAATGQPARREPAAACRAGGERVS